MIRSVGRAAAIFQQQTFEPAIIGLAHCRMDANVGSDATQHEVGDSAQPNINSRSVAQNEPLPGLSMIGSPGRGASSGMISQPGSPRTRMRPHGPGSPIPAPMRRDRQRLFAGRSARSGRCPSRVWKTWKPSAAHCREHRRDRLDRRAGKGQIVSHAVDIAADPTKIGLHVDDDQRRICRLEITIIGPGIRVGRDITLRHRQSLVLTVPITPYFN